MDRRIGYSSASRKEKNKSGLKNSVQTPITGKDSEAKRALIRESEGHWRKGFIKNYIPKIHCPLTKRRKGKARTHNRRADTNPLNWHPGVLKSVLSLAKKLDDKARLRSCLRRWFACATRIRETRDRSS